MLFQLANTSHVNISHTYTHHTHSDPKSQWPECSDDGPQLQELWCWHRGHPGGVETLLPTSLHSRSLPGPPCCHWSHPGRCKDALPIPVCICLPWQWGHEFIQCPFPLLSVCCPLGEKICWRTHAGNLGHEQLRWHCPVSVVESHTRNSRGSICVQFVTSEVLLSFNAHQ